MKYSKLKIILVFLMGLVSPLCGGPIHDAAKKGDLQRVKKLLKENPQLIDDKDKYKCDLGFAPEWTPLHWAVSQNHKKVVEYLVSQNANINARGKYGGTPLHGAAVYGYFEMASYLLNAGAEINAKNEGGETPLHLAIKGPLFKKSFEPQKTIQLLIGRGANVNAKGRYDETPLHCAVLQEWIETVQLLVTQGAKVEITTKDGLTPLHYCVLRVFNYEIADYLLKKGANININTKDINETTILHDLISRQKIDASRWCLEHGADVNAQDLDGNTPLHYAVKGDLYLLQYLVEFGADLGIKNNKKQRACDLQQNYDTRFFLEKTQELTKAIESCIQSKRQDDIVALTQKEEYTSMGGQITEHIFILSLKNILMRAFWKKDLKKLQSTVEFIDKIYGYIPTAHCGIPLKVAARMVAMSKEITYEKIFWGACAGGNTKNLNYLLGELDFIALEDTLKKALKIAKKNKQRAVGRILVNWLITAKNMGAVKAGPGKYKVLIKFLQTYNIQSEKYNINDLCKKMQFFLDREEQLKNMKPLKAIDLSSCDTTLPPEIAHNILSFTRDYKMVKK